MTATHKAGHVMQDTKGKVEETAGRVFGDDELVAHGKADQLAAHAKQIADTAQEKVKRGGRTMKEAALRRMAALHERLHEAAGQPLRSGDTSAKPAAKPAPPGEGGDRLG